MELIFFFFNARMGWVGSSCRILRVLWSIASISLAESYCPYLVIYRFCGIVSYSV